MRKLLLAALLPLALSLGACATDPVTGDVSLNIPIPSVIATNTTVQGIVTQVQDNAKKICGFLPAVETVKDVVTTFTGLPPGVDLAFTVANSICKAVTAQGARRGVAAAPMVNGVPIKGYFLSGKRYGRARHAR